LSTLIANLQQVAADVKQKARELGFDLVGIAPADPSIYREYVAQWLESGAAGEMDYLQERYEKHTDPTIYLEGAKTVICVAMSYYVPLAASRSEDASNGKIARYALGGDYHTLIKKKLEALADYIRDTVPGTKTIRGVDTAPIPEKELAARAGIGWMGKNTCIINERSGSWFFLGEVLTTLELPIDQPAENRCGSCRRCIDACPTQAITGPYQLDASKCISYLTIEHRGDIAPDLQAKMGDWLYGCDICQDVCPFNRDPLPTSEKTLQPRFPTGSLDAAAVTEWSLDEFRQQMRHSAIKRIKLPQFQRNARIVLENQGRKP
jgi:epoxyqueuosine reductase